MELLRLCGFLLGLRGLSDADDFSIAVILAIYSVNILRNHEKQSEENQKHGMATAAFTIAGGHF